MPSLMAVSHDDGSTIWKTGTVVVRAGEAGITAEVLDADTGAWEVVPDTDVEAVTHSRDTSGLNPMLIDLVRIAVAQTGLRGADAA